MNVPPSRKLRLNKKSTEDLHAKVAEAARVAVDQVQVHFTNVTLSLLKTNGSFDYHHGVHVNIQWYENQSVTIKIQIAEVIQDFLDTNGMGKDSDIAFGNYPRGSFFLNGQMA